MRNFITIILILITGVCYSNDTLTFKEFKKIDKLYQNKEYDKVLEKIYELENSNGVYTINYKHKGLYKNNPLFFHYKLSSKLYLNKKENLSDIIAEYQYIKRLDAHNYYSNLPIYNVMFDQINSNAENLLNKNEIESAKKYSNLSAKLGDTTECYKFINNYTKIISPNYNGDSLQNFIKNYDYAKIDDYAKNIQSESTIENQTWALTKDYKYDFERVRSIYTWITYNIVYDDTYKNRSKEITFSSKTGVCAGYAALFYEMCTIAGIKSNVIIGAGITIYNTDSTKYNHAWNSVVISNTNFYLDSCWGAVYKEPYYLNNNGFKDHIYFFTLYKE